MKRVTDEWLQDMRAYVQTKSEHDPLVQLTHSEAEALLSELRELRDRQPCSTCGASDWQVHHCADYRIKAVGEANSVERYKLGLACDRLRHERDVALSALFLAEEVRDAARAESNKHLEQNRALRAEVEARYRVRDSLENVRQGETWRATQAINECDDLRRQLAEARSEADVLRFDIVNLRRQLAEAATTQDELASAGEEAMDHAAGLQSAAGMVDTIRAGAWRDGVQRGFAIARAETYVTFEPVHEHHEIAWDAAEKTLAAALVDQT